MKIELRNIEKSFGELVVLDQFNISIASGEMVSITGKSGSGKTTLLNILGLIEKKDNGEILYNDQLVASASQRRKLLSESIGYIFQNFGLIDDESVYENLSIIKQLLGMRKTAKRRHMVDALQKVGLSGKYLDKKVFECSGGEQQRIAIAKILLKDCEVILADEPTASLDNENKQNILSHLKALNKLGKTVVVVSHDQDVCDHCDYVIGI